MFRKMIETIVGGTIGIAALYLVARVAYAAGHEMAEAEHDYAEATSKEDDDNHVEEESVSEEVPAPQKKVKVPSKIGLFMGLRGLLGKDKASIIGELASNPEDHKLEAYINEGEVHINIKKKRTCPTRR